MSTTILLIDPTDDAQRIKTSFEDTNHPNTVRIVDSGDDALNYIHQRDNYSNTPAPDLIILNPHLPQTDGYEILNTIKNEPTFKLAPVIVIAESEAEDDIIESYTLNANAHIQRPNNPDDYDRIVAAIEAFWIDTVHLPPIE